MKNKTEGVLKTPFNAKDSGLRCQVLTSGSESGAKGQAACPIPPPSSGECEEEAMGVSCIAPEMGTSKRFSPLIVYSFALR